MVVGRSGGWLGFVSNFAQRRNKRKIRFGDLALFFPFSFFCYPVMRVRLGAESIVCFRLPLSVPTLCAPLWAVLQLPMCGWPGKSQGFGAERCRSGQRGQCSLPGSPEPSLFIQCCMLYTSQHIWSCFTCPLWVRCGSCPYVGSAYSAI